MWIHISKIAKTIVFPHKSKVEISNKSNLTKNPQIIVENTKNTPDSSPYTIEYKSSEKFSPIISKLAFSQVPQQLFYKQA